MSARQWPFERLEAVVRWLAPATPERVGLDDYEPGCERHAYCAAVDAALAGEHVTVIPATDPADGEQVTHTFHRPLTSQQAAFATHSLPRVRAGFAVMVAREIRGDLRRRGELA